MKHSFNKLSDKELKDTIMRIKSRKTLKRNAAHYGKLTTEALKKVTKSNK
jgi:hypothetical protein